MRRRPDGVLLSSVLGWARGESAALPKSRWIQSFGYTERGSVVLFMVGSALVTVNIECAKLAFRRRGSLTGRIRTNTK
ncbi:hypothetical protein PT2222_70095 [Paraburkholderia tropica]